MFSEWFIHSVSFMRYLCCARHILDCRSTVFIWSVFKDREVWSGDSKTKSYQWLGFEGC